MRKTSEEIEEDVYHLIKDHFKDVLKGSVYRKGMRPMNATDEDAVVSFLTGMEGQFQTGVIIVNFYVPNVPLTAHSNLVEDKKRIGELLREIIKIKDGRLLDNIEYLFEVRNTPSYEVEEDIEQARITMRLNYTHQTF